MTAVNKFFDYCNQTHPWLGDLLVLLAGLLVPLGFAPFNQYFAPVIALSVLFLLLQEQTPGRAARRGFLFGIAMFGFGVSWVYNSLHDYGLATVPIAALIAASLVLVMAGYLTLLGLGYRRWLAVQPVYALLLVLPALWTLIEWLRGWLFTGFPWLLLGYSQVDTWLGAYAPVGGALLVSWVVATMAGALSLLVLARDNVCRLLAISIIVVLPLAGYGLQKINWVEPAGQPVSVALIQGAIPQDVKMQPGNLGISLERYTGLTEPYLDRDLIIWPETAIHATSSSVEFFLRNMENKVIAHHADLLTGIFLHDPGNDKYYNALLKLGDGKRSDYRKQRLVPFGEYMPFRRLLEFAKYYIEIPSADLSAATHGSAMQLAGYPVALGICYESAYPQIYRQQLPEAAFMVNVSNDAWFGDSLAPHQHLEIARMRALEAARFMLRATNSGISAVIDSRGGVVVRGKQFEKDVVTAEVTPLRGATLFALFGNWLIIPLCIIGILVAFILSSRPKNA